MQVKIANEQEKQLVFALRLEVFVKEQNVPSQIELDEEDAHALHIIAIDNGITVGCARIILSENDAHIGRLAVKKEYRKKNIGFQICKFIIDYCNNKGYKNIWLNSQIGAKGFYEKLGFKPQGETFFEAGIEHIKMAMT